MCAERELLQAYNYAVKGEKALLITTGALDSMDLLNQFDTPEAFLEALTTKYRKWTKSIDLSLGQDFLGYAGNLYQCPYKSQKISQAQRELASNSYQPIISSGGYTPFLNLG